MESCTILMWIIIIILLLIAFWVYKLSTNTFSPFQANLNPQTNTNTANYNVTFTSNWGSDKKKINSPPNPHTGNMFLVTHNNNIDLFRRGEIASKGIANTSMYGTIDDLMESIQNNPNIYDVETAPVLMTPGEQTLHISADTNNHYMSFVTMVAPSADYFTGISSLDLIKNNRWIDNMTIPLYVYDAGSDAETGFTTQHSPKQNPDPITLKNDTYLYPDNQIKPIAFLKINRT